MTELTDSRIATDHTPASVIPLRNPSPYWMETASGQRFDYLNPDPNHIRIDDIAWALSRLPRFCGHTCDLNPLTVASHSLWVGMYIWEKTRHPTLALHGLLHDAHEAYTGDIPRPIKQLPALKREIAALEERIQSAIYRALDIPSYSDEVSLLIKEADEQALANEAFFNTRLRGKHWPLPPLNDIARAIGKLEPKRGVVVFEAFMTTYHIFKARLAEYH